METGGILSHPTLEQSAYARGVHGEREREAFRVYGATHFF